MTQPRPAASTRFQGLDMLRGTAIALVLLRHAWPSVFGGAGIVGVVIFFVLSGYLITSVLLRDIRSTGRVRYPRFYRNRAFRLIPALVVLLLAVLVVSLTTNLLGDRAMIGRAMIIGITYTANFPFNVGSPAISHLWTLATEEQFYIFWPLLLSLAIRHLRERWLFIAAFAFLALALPISLIIFHADVSRVYGLFTSWAVGLVMGAMIAVFPGIISRLRSTPLLIISITVLVGVSILPDLKDQWWGYVFVGPLVAAAATVLVGRLATLEKLPRGVAPLLWLGKISYAAYLWNYPISLWLAALPIFPAAVGPLSIVLTLVVAQLSWIAVERPFQSLRSRLDLRAVQQ